MIKMIWIKMRKGTARLSTDSNGKVLGSINGMANDARNNNAKILLIRKIILLKNESFFIDFNFSRL
jgi:hypothetical protein